MKYILFFIPVFLLLSCGEVQTNQAKVQNLDSLLVLYPDSMPLLVEHGNKMIKEFNFDKAIADGAKAFRLDSTNLEARMLYAEVLNNRPTRTFSDVSIAQRHFLYIIKKQPKNTKAYVSLATTYSQQQNFDLSFKYINAALRIDSKYRDAYVLKGTNYLHTNQIELAKSSYQTAVEQDSKFFEAYLMLGSLYQAEKNELCMEYYTTARKLQPKNVDVLYAIAYAKQEFNHLNEAKQIYRQMIEVDTAYSQALFQQGYIQQWLEPSKTQEEAQRNLDSAIYFYNSTIRTAPNYVEAWHNLGVCYMNRHAKMTLEDKTKALQSFSQALKFDPNFALSRELAEKLKKLR